MAQLAAAEQADLDGLLLTHASSIIATREAVDGNAPPPPEGADWDDIWLLRYVLSYPDSVADRGECVLYLLLGSTYESGLYRLNASPPNTKMHSRAHQLQLSMLVARGEPSTPHCLLPSSLARRLLETRRYGPFCCELSRTLFLTPSIRSCIVVDYHSMSELGEPLLISRAALSRPAALFPSGVTPDELITWIMCQRESVSRMCDAQSRARRRLVKSINLVDLTGITLAQVGDRVYHETLARGGKLAERIFPQLLQRSVLVRPPRFMQALFPVLKVFVPAKLLSRIAVCPATGRSGAGLSSCPFASARFKPSTLPTFLGEGCECRCIDRGGCVAGMPNDLRAPPLQGAGSGGEVDERMISVAAGREYDLILPVKRPNCQLVYQFTLLDKSLIFSVRLDGAELVPPTRVSAADGEQSSVLPLPSAGTLHLRWENSSRFTAKQVRVSAAVMEPAAEAAAQAAAEALGRLSVGSEAA